MRPLLVASVPHTGTMFTFELLPGKRGQLPGIPRDNYKYWCHLSEPHAKEAVRQCFTVVPVRRYREVKASWERRGLNLTELARQWNEMASMRDVFFLPIDSTDREDRLAELSRHIGTTLHTDWRAVNRYAPPKGADRVCNSSEGTCL